MKGKYILIALATMLLVLSSCGKDDDLIGIQMPYRYQFDVPAGLNPLNTHFFTHSNLVTSADALIGDGTVSRIIPYTARLRSLDNVDFSFVREIEIRVVDPENPSLEIPVFYREELPLNTGPTIDLIGIQTDISAILKKPSINVVVEFKLYGTSGQTFTSDLQISFLAQE